MSMWTHVSGVFRVDDMRKILGMGIQRDFNEIIGANKLKLPFAELEEMRQSDEIVAPCGSEGGLTFTFYSNPDTSCCASDAIFFIGDLRDYDTEDIKEELIPWFKKVCCAMSDVKDGLMLRQATISAECEEGKVFQVSSCGYNSDSMFIENEGDYDL